MTAVTRSALFAALIVAGLITGCSAPTPPKPDAGGGPGSDCFVDTDCPTPENPDPNLFFCNLSTSKCEPGCHVKADCGIAVRTAANALPYCDTGLGCQCDEGKCVGSKCGSDLDCGSEGSGQVCRSGECVAAPPASSVTKCSIIPDYVVTRTGAKTKFWVSAWDAQNNPVVLNAGVTWSSADATSTIAGTGNSADFTAGTTASSGAIDGPKATIGGINCTGKVLIVDGTVAANNLKAVVTDELSGRGVAGATVLASDPATGQQVGETAVTDSSGVTPAMPITNQSINVTVFANDYNYLTITHYDMAGGSRLLSFVVRRNQIDKYGGHKGGFKNAPATSNVHAGIAGMSIAGSITDLSLTQLLGNSVPTHVKIGNAIDKDNVPLPAGVYLGFSDQQIKPTIAAQGLAGSCTGTGAETKILNGDCGTRTAWALVGDVPLGDLPIDAVAGGLNNLDFGKILSRIIPVFKKFNSSVIRDVEFSLKKPGVAADGGADYADTDFTQADHDFTQMPLTFNFVAKVPDLPKFRGTYTDGVVLLGGANVPGRGVVPLGLGVAVNTAPVDSQTDKQSDLTSQGLVTMRMAPTHHGLEGTEYGIVALALSFKSFTDPSAGIATSGLFGRIDKNQPQFDPKGANPVQLPGPFLPFPEGSHYNYTDTANGALGARTFKFVPAPDVATVTMARVVFSDGDDHRWVVYGDPSKASSPGFTLPKPPGAFLDRTFANGSGGTGGTTGTRSRMLVQLVRLNATPSLATGAAITYKQLIELNDTNGDRLTDFTTGFSFIDYAQPKVDWTTPADNGATIAKGSSLEVTVAGFKLGTTPADDGSVKVTFTGGTGCTDLTSSTDTSAGKGVVSLTLPSACAGTVTMKATLVDTQGVPISPAVSSTLTGVIIN